MQQHRNLILLCLILTIQCYHLPLLAQSSPEDIQYAVGIGGDFNSADAAEFAVAINPRVAFPALPNAGEFTAILYLPTSQVTGNEVFTILDDRTGGGQMIYQGPGFAYSDGNTYFSFVYSGSGIDLSAFDVGSFQTIFSVDVDGGNPVANWQIADASTGLFTDFGIRSALNVLGFNELVEMATISFLPVEFLDFRADIVDNQTLLSWETASEVGNAYFVVERSSNGVRFEEVAELAGAGDSDEVLYYEAWDRQPLSGTNYYRIKQVDFDGSFDYSPIRLVAFEAEQSSVLLYPNPARSFTTLSLPADFTGADLQVIDVSGKLVLDQRLMEGEAQIQLQLSDWQAGVYLIRLQLNGEVLTKRLVVTD